MARYNLDDIIALAQTVYGEARNQSFQGQLAVAYVVVNRFISNPARFGRSIFEVAHARLQFSCWNSNDPNLSRISRISYGDQEFLVALEAAAAALSGRVADPTHGADHYHTLDAPKGVPWPPSWAAAMRKTVEIGDHVFYRS